MAGKERRADGQEGGQDRRFLFSIETAWALTNDKTSMFLIVVRMGTPGHGRKAEADASTDALLAVVGS